MYYKKFVLILIPLAVIGAVCAETKTEKMTKTEKNKLLVKAQIGALNNGDLEALKELYSPKFVQHQPGNQKVINLTEYMMAHRRRVHRSILTFRFEIEDIIAEGDKVAVRLKTVVRRKPKSADGSWLSGKIELAEMDMFRIEGGRIIEEWCEFDTADVKKKMQTLTSVKNWR